MLESDGLENWVLENFFFTFIRTCDFYTKQWGCPFCLIKLEPFHCFFFKLVLLLSLFIYLATPGS